MQIWYLGLGSNLGDRQTLVSAAVERLTAASTAWRLSSLYETEPVDYPEQPWFLNAVLEVRFDRARNPHRFLRDCLALETEFGRLRTVPRGARTLDVDVLLLSEAGQPLVLDAVHEEIHLCVPHPRLHLRRFVLEPLCDLCPESRHPVIGKTFRELLETLADSSVVQRQNPDCQGGLGSSQTVSKGVKPET